MKWTIIGSVIALAVLTIISLIVGLFTFWTFIGIIFYIVMFVGGFIYIKVGIENSMNEEEDIYRRKQRFDWCWERVNILLKSMPGGQGIQWASGVGRKSIYKTYHDGIQNKPFRSMLAHLENSQQLVAIIYDIDNDDIVSFITNPSPDVIDNPFLNFKPFSRGEGGGGFSRFSPYGSRYPSSRSRSGRRPISIRVGDDDYDDFSGGGSSSQQPNQGSVDKAVDILKK